MDSATHSPRSFLTWIIGTAVGLCLLYALSSGPAFMLVTIYGRGNLNLLNIYTPLMVASRSTRTAPALDRYLIYWMDLGHRHSPPER